MLLLSRGSWLHRIPGSFFLTKFWDGWPSHSPGSVRHDYKMPPSVNQSKQSFPRVKRHLSSSLLVHILKTCPVAPFSLIHIPSIDSAMKSSAVVKLLQYASHAVFVLALWRKSAHPRALGDLTDDQIENSTTRNRRWTGSGYFLFHSTRASRFGGGPCARVICAAVIF